MKCPIGEDPKIAFGNGSVAGVRDAYYSYRIHGKNYPDGREMSRWTCRLCGTTAGSKHHTIDYMRAVAYRLGGIQATEPLSQDSR